MSKTKLKIVISALAHTAIEKYCVAGNEAMPKILQLKEVAEELAEFWGMDDLKNLFLDTLKGKGIL